MVLVMLPIQHKLALHHQVMSATAPIVMMMIIQSIRAHLKSVMEKTMIATELLMKA